MTTKKIDSITQTTKEFLHDLRNTETIYFEILTDVCPFAYGLRKEQVAEMALEIDKYNLTSPPAKIRYSIEKFTYNGEKEEEIPTEDRNAAINQKVKTLFPPTEFKLEADENGNVLLTNEQFQVLFELFAPFFVESYSRGELISYLTQKNKK